MYESLEIVCVLRESAPVPSLPELQQALTGSGGYELEIEEGFDDHAYMHRPDQEEAVGVMLVTHDADSYWYTVPSLPAINMGITAFSLNTGDFDRRLQSVLEHAEHVYRSLEACQYVFGLDEDHADLIGRDPGPDLPVSPSSLSEQRIEEVSWLMLFPPEMVQNYGRDWLLSAPAWERRELDDGAIMLVLAPDPGDWEESKEARQDAAAYFESVT